MIYGKKNLNIDLEKALVYQRINLVLLLKGLQKK